MEEGGGCGVCVATLKMHYYSPILKNIFADYLNNTIIRLFMLLH